MKYQNKQYVRWGDLDAFGHVNNATYLVYAQEARFAWSKMIEMVVARAEVDFIAPIYTGDIYIDVEIWVNKIGNSSFGLTYEMKNGDELLARIKTVQVTVSMETKKSRPLTESEREFLTKYFEEEK
jgi:acyl-CoA thioester hydrolase